VDQGKVLLHRCAKGSQVNFNTLKARTDILLATVAKGGDIADAYHPDAVWNGVHPFNERQGHDQIRDVWQTLRTALPDMERRTTVLVAGENLPDDRISTPRHAHLVACMGQYKGTFAHDLLGIRATNNVVHIRFCEAHHVVDGKIAWSTVMLDLADLMMQVGQWPLAPSLGAEGQWQYPMSIGPDHAGTANMDLVLKMHAALGDFDGKNLDSMPHGQFWHDDFLWYGPAGIGTTRGLSGFRAHHQIPFLKAFPDRAGAGHYIRIDDGDIAVTGGWPSVTATHTGEFMGMAPSGQKIDMRVMDFYRIADGKIAENWVPIDVIHIALQMGVDVFARLRHRNGAHPTQL
jgi:predicted ester cyclase